MNHGAHGVLVARPRSRWMRNFGPQKLCAAVAPRHRIMAGAIAWISAVSQPRQASTSTHFGFACRRRLPRGSHLKCLTAFVR